MNKGGSITIKLRATGNKSIIKIDLHKISQKSYEIGVKINPK